MTDHIVAIFESDAVADLAARELKMAGVPASAIRRYRPETMVEMATDTSSRGGETTTSTGGGFWAWLLGEETGPVQTHSLYRDEETYRRGAHAGHAVVSVMVPDESQVSRVVTILEAHHPLEMQEDTDDTDVNLPARELLSQNGTPSTSNRSSVPAGNVGSASRAESTPRPGSAGDAEEIIPLAEERLEVGKRTVDRGTTRVRRYVVERPVEQQVTLRGERVTIERRRPVGPADAPAGAFEERVVEVREKEEVPDVTKTAGVVEEVAIRKEETERTETVRDTVRRDEVEVTDDQGRPVRP